MSFTIDQLFKDDYEVTQDQMDTFYRQLEADEDKRNFVETNFTRLHSEIDKANSRGEPLMPHLVADMIIRRLFKGEKPSEVIEDGQQPIPNQPVEQLKVQTVRRNDRGVILSHEDTSKRKARYVEVDLIRTDYKISIFNHVIDTLFEEFVLQEEKETQNFERIIQSMEDELTRLKAAIGGTEAQLAVSESEKARLQSAITAANAQLSSLSNQMSEQQTKSQQALDEAQKSAANSIKETMDKLISEMNKKDSKVDSLNRKIDSLQDNISDAKRQADAAKREAEEAKRKANEKQESDETEEKISDKDITTLSNEPDTGTTSKTPKDSSSVRPPGDIANIQAALPESDKIKAILAGKKEGNTEAKRVNNALKLDSYESSVDTVSTNTFIPTNTFDNIVNSNNNPITKITDKIEESKSNNSNNSKKRSLEARISELKGAIRKYETELDGYKEEKSNLYSEAVSLVKKWNNGDTSVADRMQKNLKETEKVKVIIDVLEKQLSTYRTELKQLTKELNAL